ncbi:NAD(P)/FAD-dependent oxidoreductase [Cellulomonas sp. PhB150]|uniref:NAD(P)/FAD-dependent oxidoreductase n=1 Tax=Cellulomonas sp. PhB150 TaxID=2485188 RepID=UPI000F46B71A|nr:NAD(P)/FAD-dependent oxidoreductase [Cellulomonas sp. PhB150]ROS27880.1 NADH dehydrogenase [Cellulomonas sp. PhB150]
MDTPLHHVVIVGSGFGGLFAAQAFAHAPVRVTVLSGTNHHLFQPLLYQVATGVLSSGEIAPPTREVLKRQRNVRVLLGLVTHIDLDAREVVSTSPLGERRTSYDSIIVAAGAGQSYFGNDRFAQFAPGLKSLDDALEVRGRILGAFELAELSTDDETLDRLLTFVVVGAGATGVEMAGQIAELSRRTLPGTFRHIDPSRTRVVVIDPVPQVLPGYSDKLSRAAADRLESLGVELWMGRKVVDVDEDGVVVVDGEGHRTRLEAACKVWAAGVGASPLAAQLAEDAGAPTDRAGRIEVEEDCTLPGHPEVFVVGDLMTINGYPWVAQLAMQSGTYAAKAITRRVRGEEPGPPFRYRDKGMMATVARFHAVARIGRFETAGLLAWLLWLGVHLLYLIGFKNRVSTLMHWVVSFVGRSRSEQVATWQQVVGRNALRREGSPPLQAQPGTDPT